MSFCQPDSLHRVPPADNPPSHEPISYAFKFHHTLTMLLSKKQFGTLLLVFCTFCLATNRTACGILRSCSAGWRSPFVRSRDVGAVICLCGFTSGLAVSLWRSRRGCQGTRGTENGERGWRRGLCASLRGHIGLEILSAGSTLGAARPQTCAKESLTLWTLFF